MIAFIHIEKTAGVTLNQILRRSFGTRHLDISPINPRSYFITPSDLRLARTMYCNISSIAGHTVRPTDELREKCPELKYYSFFREPLTRTASHYQYQVQVMGIKEPFETWIRRDEYRNFQVQKLAGTEDLAKALGIMEQSIEFVGLTNRFDESLAILKQHFEQLGIRVSYSPRNVAKSNTIKKQLLDNSKSRLILEEANKLDQLLFEHATNRFETQVRAFRGDLALEVEKGKSLRPNISDTLHYGSNVLIRNVYYKPIVSVMRAWR